MTFLAAEGDSMTSPGLDYKWTDGLTGFDVANFAWGGDRAARMVSEYAGEAHTVAPWTSETAWFSLWAGTNDLINGTETAAQIFSELKTLWGDAHADGYHVLAFTILPSTMLTPERETVRDQLNAMIRADTLDYNGLIDAAAMFPTVNATDFKSDGTHLTATAQQQVTNAALAILGTPDGLPYHVPLIHGTSGNDVLTATETGTQLWGGAGNDWYFLTDNSQRVWEGANCGFDVIQTSATYYALQPHTSIEMLEPMDLHSTQALTFKGNGEGQYIYGNDGTDHLTGGCGNDRIYGGAGIDIIDGGGGHDYLFGGPGADTFIFKNGYGSSTIGDFTPVDDTIKLGGYGLTSGHMIDATQFYIGPAAHTASDRIIYDQAHGLLYYDPDGTGAAPQQLIATLKGCPALTQSDIWGL